MIFPKEFFEESTYMGFTTAELMKRLWAASIEVIEAVDKVCKENDIKYFADFGTLLGAVRHKGFIPWDDDVDLSMLREDYDKFIQVAPTALPKNFVLSGMYSDSNLLKESNKTLHIRVIADPALTLPELMTRFHSFPFAGIGIDIFPLDYEPRNDNEASDIVTVVAHIMELTTNWDDIKNDRSTEKKLKEIEQACGASIDRKGDVVNQLLRLADAVCALTPREESDIVVNFESFVMGHEAEHKKECFDEIIDLPFEVMQIKAPKGYDAVLTAEYGDYMTPKRVEAYHGYPCYAEQEKLLRKQFDKEGMTCSITEFCRDWSKMVDKM